MELSELDMHLTHGGIPTSEIRRAFFDANLHPRQILVKKNPTDTTEEFLRYWQRATGGLELYWIPKPRVQDDNPDIDPSIQHARSQQGTEELWLTEKGVNLITESDSLASLKNKVTKMRKERGLPNQGIGISLSKQVTESDFGQLQEVLKRITDQR